MSFIWLVNGKNIISLLLISQYIRKKVILDYTDSSEEESTDAYSDEDSMNDKNKDKAPLKNPISVDSNKVLINVLRWRIFNIDIWKIKVKLKI